MEAFEYVMVLVSIIVGLAIAHVLAAFGSAVQRIRGYGRPIRLDAVYLLWVAFLFIWLVSFWWWEFKFQDVAVEWTFGLYLFIVGYAICLFATTVVLVPDDMASVEDSFEWLVAGRRWIFGAFLVLVLVDAVDTFLKGAGWAMRPAYLVQAAVVILACAIALATTRRRWHLLAAVAAFGVQFGYMFMEVGILGGW